MKNKNTMYLVIVIVLVVIILIAAAIMHALPKEENNGQNMPINGSQSTTTAPNSNTDEEGYSTYVNDKYGFSILYPTSLKKIKAEEAGFIDNLNTDDVFVGQIPDAAFKGTNLRDVTIIAGGKKVDQNACLNELGGNNVKDQNGAKISNVTINGINFSMASVNDAGAGNFYNDIRYSTYKGDTCYEMLAIAHSVNSGVLQDSEPNVKQYSDNLFMPEFNEIVSTFHFLAS